MNRIWSPVLALLLLAGSAAATDVLLKNDGLSDGSTAALQAGLIENETAAAVLAAQPADYPIKLKDLQVFMAKHTLVAGTTATVRLYVWTDPTPSGGSPTLGDAVYVSPNLTFTINAFNLWNVESANIQLSGDFTVGAYLVNTNQAFGLNSPNCVTDTNGCQAGKNWIRQTNGVWANLCSFGASGDWAIRATAELVNDPGQFIELGFGLAGNFAPTLAGSGSLAGGASFALDLAGMPPSTTGLFFTGLGDLYAPFKGGTLVPAPDFAFAMPTGSGVLTLPASMPVGLPTLSLYNQAWFPDAGGPKGASATNGLQLITP